MAPSITDTFAVFWASSEQKFSIACHTAALVAYMVDRVSKKRGIAAAAAIGTEATMIADHSKAIVDSTSEEATADRAYIAIAVAEGR